MIVGLQVWKFVMTISDDWLTCTFLFRGWCILRVEEDENIADLSPYDKYKQISSCIRL